MARPMRQCTKPGCNALTDYSQSYCSKHKGAAAKQYNQQVRFNKDNKHIADFYNSKEWKQTRNSFIVANPLCLRCLNEGAVTPARLVHHITEVREDFSKRLEWENLESICQAHHNAEHKAK